jgi:hypothetical protein
MSFDVRKIPVIGKPLDKGIGGVTGGRQQRHGAIQYQITDIGRKRMHSMENMSGPELAVLQALSMRPYPITGWELLNAMQGQMDAPTLKVVLGSLINDKKCVQKLE